MPEHFKIDMLVLPDTFDISIQVGDCVLVTKIFGISRSAMSGRRCPHAVCCQTGMESYLLADLRNAGRDRWIWPNLVSDLSNGFKST